MTPVLFYLLKLSISLSVVYLFYQFVLRRLTFYNWNRWYLIGYSLLSFVIPFVDISLVLEQNQWSDTPIIQLVPYIEVNTVASLPATTGSPVTISAIIQSIIYAGFAVMFLRFVLQLFSFRKLLKKARMIPAEGMNLYEVSEPIIPFSFGNSIFINRNQHSDEELSDIILHEFVHVKQKHSIDIIFSELLCLLNWYNPFAWLIRKAIRQNLEFIADNQVLQNGIDKKQYQYLLLKVIGNDHFCIASKFNFSSLKKRIAMMNKMKSAGVHLVKFLFILPLVAVLLVAFRNKYQSGENSNSDLLPSGNKSSFLPVIRIDTVPSVKVTNSKGYYIDIKGVNGTCTVVVKDKEGKEVEKVLLDEWKENARYENQYGEILPPPPMPPTIAIVAIGAIDPQKPIEPVKPNDPIHPIEPVAPVPPVRSVHAGCCSECPEGFHHQDVVAVGGHILGLKGVATDYEINDKKATIKLKNGTIETYDLTKPEDKAKFESKYGKIIHPAGVNGPIVASTYGVEGVRIVPTVAKGTGGTTVFAPMNGKGVTIVDEYGATITGKEDILIKITSNTTRDELEKFKSEMKEKGIDLTFDEIEYNEKGKLVVISGRMKSKNGQSNFVATDFEFVLLSMVKKDDQTIFKVTTKDKDVI